MANWMFVKNLLHSTVFIHKKEANTLMEREQTNQKKKEKKKPKFCQKKIHTGFPIPIVGYICVLFRSFEYTE